MFYSINIASFAPWCCLLGIKLTLRSKYLNMWLKCSDFQFCFQKDLKNHTHAFPHPLISEPKSWQKRALIELELWNYFKTFYGIAFTYSSLFYDSLNLNCLTSGYKQHLITHIDHIISLLWKLYVYLLLEKIISILKEIYETLYDIGWKWSDRGNKISTLSYYPEKFLLICTERKG